MPDEGTAVAEGALQTHDVYLDRPEAESHDTTDVASSESQQDQASEADSNGQEQGKSPQQPQQKRESRYERTKREKKEFRQRQAQHQREYAQFQQERELLALERAKFEEQRKPKRDYTLPQLKRFRNEWNNEGKYDLVEKADKEIAAMEAEEQAERAQRTVEMPPLGSPQHMAQWHQAERELYDADPQFMRQGTPLDGKLREIMSGQDGQIYRQHPRGIVAAYHRARMELLEGDVNTLRTENSNLKTELQRLTGLTSIDGGTLSKVGRGNGVENVNDFARLSSKDMRKHLMRTAQRGSTPWF